MTPLRERSSRELVRLAVLSEQQLLEDRAKLATPYGQGFGWLRRRIRQHELWLRQAQAELERRTMLFTSGVGA